jgi:hypothetical protein
VTSYRWGMENTHAYLILIGPMARRLHVTTAWLRAEADAGRVPCLKAGSRYLFSPEAVMRVLAERAAQPQGVAR